MKTIYSLVICALLVIITISCEEESDMAIQRVVAPVVVELEDASAEEIKATFFELDKSGILDHTVGIDSLPVSNLSIEVFAASSSVGVFTTDGSGVIIVPYTGSKPNEFAGTYKGIAFRIKK